MSTGVLVQASTVTAAGGGALVSRDVAQWLAARAHEAATESSFTLEAELPFFRLRRVRGAAASSIEARLPMHATLGDLAQAVIRWAPTVGLTARAQADAEGFRLTLSRPQD